MLALRERLRESGWFSARATQQPNLAEFLDLVALGTVADMASMDHNNRILVAQGIARINAGRCRPGIVALLAMGKRTPGRIVTSDLGFVVGPRLNAAGRLDDITVGVECLLTDDRRRATETARMLDGINIQRRAIEAAMQQQAIDAVSRLHLNGDERLPAGLSLFDPAWHEGVVGLVAARIRERTDRPVVAFAPGLDGNLKGSARSLPGLHIRDVLQAVDAHHPGLLLRYGGHSMAAGVSIAAQRFDVFRTAFDAEVDRAMGTAEPVGCIYTDGELPGADTTLALADTLREAAPWGKDFPEPSFDGEFDVLSHRIVGERHLKLRLRPVSAADVFDAIGFRYCQAGENPEVPKRVRIAYRLEANEYRGVRAPQLIVEHLQDAP
jgi:single-stranded-DNA-specific exonuclease